MNPLAIKGLASIIAFAFVLLFIRHEINQHDKGIRDAEDAIWQKREADTAAKVEADVAARNKAIAALQATINEETIQLAAKEKELSDEIARSESLQSDLTTAHQRMYARGTLSPGIAAQQAPSTEPAAVGKGAEVVVQLEPEIAANLAKLAGEGDAAITRLNACVDAYEAVQKAVNGE